MRSYVKHLAKCGEESLHFCRTRLDIGQSCGRNHLKCRFALKTCPAKKDKNEIHPIAIELTLLFTDALTGRFLDTAWCIDLARFAFGWEQVAKATGKDSLFVQNKIREKIEKDKGVKII